MTIIFLNYFKYTFSSIRYAAELNQTQTDSYLLIKYNGGKFKILEF